MSAPSAARAHVEADACGPAIDSTRVGGIHHRRRVDDPPAMFYPSLR